MDGFTSYYIYDADGQRVRKVIEKTGGIKEERYYLGNYEVYRKFVGITLETERTTVAVADDKRKIATIDKLTVDKRSLINMPVAVIRYQYDNHLGSASLELDATAQIISYEEYYPFGSTSYRSGRSETEVSQKRYKYVGKERDEETGLYYYGFRYYAPWIARFINVDPLQHEYPHYTPFQYAGNKPITYIDLDGLEEGVKDEKFIRFQIVELAKQYAEQNPNKTYGFNPENPTPSVKEVANGATIDCSGFIRALMIQVGLGDPFVDENGKRRKGMPIKGSKKFYDNGVAIIISGLEKIDINNIKEGDLITMRTDRTTHKGPNNGDYDHIALISRVIKENGKVIGFDYYDSGGDNSKVSEKNPKYIAGPRVKKNYYINKKNSSGSVTGAYRLMPNSNNEESKLHEEEIKYYELEEIAGAFQKLRTIKQGEKPSFAEDLYYNSRIPIVKTFSELLMFFGF